MSRKSYPRSYRVVNRNELTNWNHVSETLGYTTLSDEWDNSSVSTDLPNWRAVIKAHGNATTSFSASRRELVYSPGIAFAKGWTTGNPTNWRQRRYDGYLLSPSSIAPGDPDLFDSSNASSEALGKFYSRIRDTYNSFQGGVFLGELAETVRLIRNPVKALRQEIDHYVSSARRRARRERSDRRKNRVIANTWLEYQYGLAPLYSDASSAYDTLTRQSKAFTSGEIIPISSFARSDSDEHRSRVSAGLNQTFSALRLIKGEVTVRYKGGVRGRPSAPSLGDASIWGLHPRDFVPTIWELIPYSFLVDYFSNAGKVIESWSVCTSNVSWKCRTIRKSSSGSYIGWQHENEWLHPLDQLLSPPTMHWVRTSISRTNPTLGTPDFYFKLPGSSTKFLNIAALFRARHA